MVGGWFEIRSYGMPVESLGRSCLLLMLQDVDQFSQWITYIEPAHSPRLRLRAVFDRDVRFLDSHQSLFNVIHFDRYIRDSSAGSSLGHHTDLDRHLRP